MRNLFKAAVGVAILGAAAASASAQGVKGSAHDFVVQEGVNPSYNFQTLARSLCSTCHTIHNALSQDAPLWIHTTTAATFTPYTSGTMNATTGQPQNNTRACLSCHDGTVAVNSVNGNTVTGGVVNGPVYIGGAALLGTDLSNDHPVSIQYGADPALQPAAGVQTYFPLFGPSKNMMECATCHDPHTPTTSNLFLRGYTGSGFTTRCLVCHIK